MSIFFTAQVSYHSFVGGNKKGLGKVSLEGKGLDWEGL